MNKRLEQLEGKVQQPDMFIRKLYRKWVSDEITLTEARQELESIFEDNPEWRHRPPVSVGRMAYIEWESFTGNKHQP